MQVEAWVSQQPSLNQRCLVGAVVIQNEMHVQVGWHFRINAIQELPKLGRAMSAMHFTDHLARSHVQGGKERCCPVTLVVVRPPLGLAGLQWQVAGFAQALGSGSSHPHTRPAHVRRVQSSPTMSRTFSINCGSVDNLNVSVRCGWSPKACQIRKIAVRLRPLLAAIERTLQCVALRGSTPAF